MEYTRTSKNDCYITMHLELVSFVCQHYSHITFTCEYLNIWISVNIHTTSTTTPIKLGLHLVFFTCVKRVKIFITDVTNVGDSATYLYINEVLISSAKVAVIVRSLFDAFCFWFVFRVFGYLRLWLEVTFCFREYLE